MPIPCHASIWSCIKRSKLQNLSKQKYFPLYFDNCEISFNRFCVKRVKATIITLIYLKGFGPIHVHMSIYVQTCKKCETQKCSYHINFFRLLKGVSFKYTHIASLALPCWWRAVFMQGVIFRQKNYETDNILWCW